MNGRVCGALVQFGCYQHKHKWMSLSPIYIKLSLEVTCISSLVAGGYPSIWFHIILELICIDNVMRIPYVVTLVANYCNHEQYYYIVPQYQSYHILWHKNDTVTYYAIIIHMQPFLWQYGSNYRRRVYTHASFVLIYAGSLFLEGLHGIKAIPVHACIAGNNSGHVIWWKYATCIARWLQASWGYGYQYHARAI